MALAGPVQLSQGATKRFDFTFIGAHLPFAGLDNFKDLLHLIERQVKGIDHFINVVNGGGDAGRLSGSRGPNPAWRSRFRLLFLLAGVTA